MASRAVEPGEVGWDAEAEGRGGVADADVDDTGACG